MKRPKASELKDVNGVIAAAITPRRANEYSIDLAATLELVDFLGANGADAIELLGSTGEFIHFALDDRRHMLNFAAKRSRVPLLVNVSHSTLDGAIDLARDAAEDGVAGILIMPPYYFPYGQAEIHAFLLQFAQALDGMVPVYLYNVPSCTSPIEMDTALDLLGTGLFAGIQEPSNRLEAFDRLSSVRNNSDFKIFASDETIYPYVCQAKADGVISGIACAVPELVAALSRECGRGNLDTINRLATRINEFRSWMYQFPFPVAIKQAAALRKLNTGALAVPLSEAGCRKLDEFRAWFAGWLPGVLKECAG